MLALGILLAFCPCAFALDRSLDVNQYAHTAWTGEGVFKGTIRGIAQTPDGYLWLGTEFGLLRFDGVRAVTWQPPPGQHLPSDDIYALLVAHDGTVWIGTTKGLASWRDGKLTQYPELAEQYIFRLLEDRGGTVWAGSQGAPTGRLCAIRYGTVKCYGEDGSLGRGVAGLYEDSKGNLWVGVQDGIWRWKPGPPNFYPIPGSSDTIKAFCEDDSGMLLFGTFSGIRRLVDGKAEDYPLPRTVPHPLEGRMFLRDHDGSLWIGTGHGVIHQHQERTDVFSQADGLSGDAIQLLFEDRERNIWVATLDGLDRFHDLAVTTISAKQGLSDVASVLAASDGSVWFGTIEGLRRLKNGRIGSYGKLDANLKGSSLKSLLQDGRGRIWVSTTHNVGYLENDRLVSVSDIPGGSIVSSSAEDTVGSLWLANRDHGLIQLHGDSVIQQIPWANLGRKDFANVVTADTLEGGLWLGYWQSGVAYFKDGQVRKSYAPANGLGEGRVDDLQVDRDGTLWAATQGGLSRIRNGRVDTLTTRNGLPCNAVHWMMEDDEHSVWLSLACGLVRIARPDLDAWVSNPKRAIQSAVFDSSDGVRSHTKVASLSPHVSKSQDGKIWFKSFLSYDGVSVIDPRHLPFNKLPPPVHIEQITADRKTYWQNSFGDASSTPPKLPPLVHDLQIDYTALSFVAPEKVRFRIKLEGRDPDWKDAGNERKAFYNDLPPHHYRFRVIASNNSGVWNETGDTLDFSVDPAYYQTAWFQAACVAAFLGVLWGLHRYRLHQIAEKFNARLDGRVDERLRVARDLHDTLLQSFHGLLMQFQSARNLLRGRAEDVAQVLDRALDDAARAITEARDTVQAMRLSTVITNELAKAVRVLAQELAGQQRAVNEDATAFSVEVEGASRELHPILRDEVYRITGEALRNAFRHAQARRIEVEILYEVRKLRIRMRDNGIGMDASVLDEGREGHWGLPGMRERAKAIGGTLEVWSEQGAGTEVELTIPASVAYGSPAGRRFRLFNRKTGTNS